MNISLLELGDAPDLQNEMITVQNVLTYASEADRLGFSRFWLAEHYDLMRPWNNPELLLPLIAAATERIRVGSAGILLSVHSPYRVAMNFKMLANLFPGRVDLGLARGLAPLNTARALLTNDALGSLQELKDLFDPKLAELLNFLRNEEAQKDKDMVLPPYKGELPALWSLARSYRNLSIAMEMGTNFCISLFHKTLGEPDIPYEKELLARFREDFYDRYRSYPRVAVALEGLCHDDVVRLESIIRYKGADYFRTEKHFLAGSPAYFYDKLNQLAELFGVDDFVILNSAVELEDKIHALELLNDAFQLSSPQEPVEVL
jgi:luciferase family oxidoreductase group 1